MTSYKPNARAKKVSQKCTINIQFIGDVFWWKKNKFKANECITECEALELYDKHENNWHLRLLISIGLK